MIKLWRFLSVPIVLVVCLGLALVPGVPLSNNVALASSNVTIHIDPSLKQVGFNEVFTLDVVVDNPLGMPLGNADVFLDFDPTYFNVTGVVNGDMPENFGQGWDNSTGEVYSSPYYATGNTTATSVLLCTVQCKSKGATGESTVDFVWSSPPPRKTVIIEGITDYLENGNMSLMFDGTVKVSGAPVLTVNVTPNGTGTVTANGVTLIGYPNTTNWTTGDNVTLLAVNSTPGWGFHNWTGDPVPATNPTTITMDSDKNVTANFVLLPPQISPDPISLTFNANVGENPANQTLDICNGGGGILNWTANITGTNVTWLSMSLMSGGNLTAAQCSNSTVAVNTTGLTAGTYYANITINATAGGGGASSQGAAESAAINGVAPVVVPVTLNLGVPEISVSPTPLTFTTNEGENPPSQTLEICNTGTGTLNWSLSDGGTAWLSESPTSGSLGAGECEDVTVSVDTTGMAAGDYTATITITGSPTVSVPVTLHIVSGMPEIPVKPASVSASALDISPQQVKPGQDVTISINVANTGGETGPYNAVLYINGAVEDSQSVSVAGGTSKNVIFTVTKSKAGVYDVSLAGQTGQFEVVGGGWFGGGLGLGTGGIIAIVVIVIALIVAVIFILRGTARPE